MVCASGWAATFLSQHPILLDELLDDRIRNRVRPGRAGADLQRQLAAPATPSARWTSCAKPPRPAVPPAGAGPGRRPDVEKLADHLSAAGRHHRRRHHQAVWQTVATRHREVPLFAVIAYGKLGGKELGYVSDLDVIFLYDDDDQDAPAQYAKLAQRFITWMTSHTSAGILFDIDTALRPDGASGMLVSSVGVREIPEQFGLGVGTPGADARALLRRRRRHRPALRAIREACCARNARPAARSSRK
jgi:glutamate-ammonia-ligase adenylyltransferase